MVACVPDNVLKFHFAWKLCEWKCSIGKNWKFISSLCCYFFMFYIAFTETSSPVSKDWQVAAERFGKFPLFSFVRLTMMIMCEWRPDAYNIGKKLDNLIFICRLFYLVSFIVNPVLNIYKFPCSILTCILLEMSNNWLRTFVDYYFMHTGPFSLIYLTDSLNIENNRIG